MNDAVDQQTYLSERLTASGWHIARTIALGIAAAGLAVFGEECLARARPIFPLIDQNYGLWQLAYAGVLLVMALVWAAAVLQKINLYQNCLQHMRQQRQLDELRQRRVLKAQQAKEAREAERRARDEQRKAAAPPRFQSRGISSSKFDY
ncbi:MAG: hypothetical protein ACEQSK_00710 [Sphingomonadaceae bacterium]